MTARRLVLLAVNVVLATLLAAAWQEEVDRDEGPGASVPVARNRDQAAVLNVPSEPTSIKPLFRLPKPVVSIVPDDPVPVVDPRPVFRLVGVVWGAADSIAIVQVAEEGPHWRARVGETVDGWQLTEVTPRSATFRSDERTVSLDLLRHRSITTADPR